MKQCTACIEILPGSKTREKRGLAGSFLAGNTAKTTAKQSSVCLNGICPAVFFMVKHSRKLTALRFFLHHLRYSIKFFAFLETCVKKIILSDT